MRLPSLWSSPLVMSDPFRREMEDMIRAFDRNLPALNIGAKAPAINVAETANVIEVTAELPGVNEKDIKVGLEGNRLTISGEKNVDRRQRVTPLEHPNSATCRADRRRDPTPNNTVAFAACETLRQPALDSGVERKIIFRRLRAQRAMWCQNGGERERHWSEGSP
jgi:hypothetical protein